jgi:hypothetical protein
MKKKKYITPELVEFKIDNSISLMMASGEVPKLPEFGDGSKSPGQSPSSDPFASPFGDKPFN